MNENLVIAFGEFLILCSFYLLTTLSFLINPGISYEIFKLRLFFLKYSNREYFVWNIQFESISFQIFNYRVFPLKYSRRKYLTFCLFYYLPNSTSTSIFDRCLNFSFSCFLIFNYLNRIFPLMHFTRKYFLWNILIEGISSKIF